MRIIFARSPLASCISSLNRLPLLRGKWILPVFLLAIAFSQVEAKAESVKQATNNQKVKDAETNAFDQFFSTLDQFFSTSNEFTKQSFQSSSVQKLYERAIQKIKGEDYEGAIADLTVVIEQNPNFAPAYDYRGIAKYQLSRYRGAISDFSEAIRIDPRNVQYQKNQRYAQDALANPKNAQQSNQQIINQNTVLPQKQTSQDCIDLTIMTKLAEIAEDKAESIKIIKQLKFNACDLGIDLGGSFDYPNGNRAKWSSSTWDYPNGNRAKWSSSTWDYPNGNRAMWSSDTWDYPNGNRAKWSSSTWDYPNGNRVGSLGGLLAASCSKLDEQTCSNRLSNFNSMDTSLQDLTAIELAWLAYKTEQKQQKRN